MPHSITTGTSDVPLIEPNLIGWQDFMTLYKPIVPSTDEILDGEQPFVDTHHLSTLTRRHSTLKIWTLIEADCEHDETCESYDTGHWYVCPGVHLVNRLGYIVTERPWDDSTQDVLYD